MEIRDNSPQQPPLKYPRVRRAIGATIMSAVIGLFLASPIIHATPQDRAATAIIVGVIVLILALLFLPTQFNNWYERRNRR